MRYLFAQMLASFVCLCGIGSAQTAASPRGNVTQSPQTAVEAPQLSPLLELPHPEIYAISFLPIVRGSDGMAFMISPAGQLGTIPMKDLAVASRAGYRPFTAADLVAIANSIADEERTTKRRVTELSEDYDALVARYNRLAAITSVPIVQPQPAVETQPVVDKHQAMRAMLFQSLVKQAFPTPPIRVQVQQQTVDCNKYPALCVNH